MFLNNPKNGAFGDRALQTGFPPDVYPANAGRDDRGGARMTFFCHARVLLSGIHTIIIPGFPPGKCGNDSIVGFL